VFQSLPLDGVVIVSSPQDLVSMIVQKAAHMADMMKVPVLGLVENMSYVICPDCGKEIRVFGDSHIEEIAEKFGYELLGKITMDYKLAALVDKGWIEMMENSYLEAAADAIERQCPVSQDEE
jgi:Mrp family chromosome partitioning ATPase